MALAAGTRFGPFEVAESIGAGGMGEVYRATDTNLERDVAVKVLPESFAADSDRIARFEREAKTLASLNHPNIAQVYGLEKADGATALVMELVDGPTLADRIAEGAIAPDEALGIARQVADALEAAHGAQIVHRDLKPANIKLRGDGTVKVLDFGIAKAIDPQAISGARSPVMTTPAMTETGVILGTAAYMSPEQARGKLVDQRTDIWAFGCLLFEMLTGQPAFGGEDVMLTLARVLDRDTDMSSIPGTISPAVRHTIKLCLQKDPRKRLADIRDVRLALNGALDSEMPRVADEAEPRAVWRRALPAMVAAVVAAAITFVAFGGGGSAPPPEVRRSIHVVPDAETVPNLGVPVLAVSPDGGELVYAAGGALYLRRLSELDARQVPGTDGENPIVPTFSPDGQWILYGSNADGQLKRVAIEGGTPLPILPEWPSGGWRWPVDDYIYYGAGEAIGRVPAAGGPIEVLAEQAGYLHFEPRLLPGGERLVIERRPAPNQPEVAVVQLATGESTMLFPGKQPQFVEPGYLVYFEPTLGLMARSFDPDALAYGNPIALVDDVAMTTGAGAVQYRVSTDGDLIYIKGQVAAAGGVILGLVTEAGRTEALDVPPRDYSFPSVSPAGDQVAVQVGANDDADIFVYDLSGDSEIRQLTFDGSNRQPAWTPDGQWISYSSNRDGRWRIYRQRADGSGVAEALTEPADNATHRLPAWTPDGEQLAYTQNDAENGDDIWIVRVPDGTPELLVGGEASQLGSAFSPNGDAIAYFSNASGTAELLVEPFPRDGSRTRISEEGVDSIWPVWSTDGTRLSYQLANGGGAAVDLTVPGFGIRNRRALPFNVIPFQRRVASMPDSDRMLVAAPQSLANDSGFPSMQIVIVEHWIEELKQRVPQQ